MTNETRIRAYHALIYSKNTTGLAFSKIFIVGNKLFWYYLPAMRYRKEATENSKPLEIVTLEEALAESNLTMNVKSTKFEEQLGTSYEMDEEEEFITTQS